MKSFLVAGLCCSFHFVWLEMGDIARLTNRIKDFSAVIHSSQVKIIFRLIAMAVKAVTLITKIRKNDLVWCDLIVQRRLECGIFLNLT